MESLINSSLLRCNPHQLSNQLFPKYPFFCSPNVHLACTPSKSGKQSHIQCYGSWHPGCQLHDGHQRHQQGSLHRNCQIRPDCTGCAVSCKSHPHLNFWVLCSNSLQIKGRSKAYLSPYRSPWWLPCPSYTSTLSPDDSKAVPYSRVASDPLRLPKPGRCPQMARCSKDSTLHRDQPLYIIEGFIM